MLTNRFADEPCVFMSSYNEMTDIENKHNTVVFCRMFSYMEFMEMFTLMVNKSIKSTKCDLSCVSALCGRFTSPKTKTGHWTAAAERSQCQWEEQRVSKSEWIVLELRLFLPWQQQGVSVLVLIFSVGLLCSFMTPLHVAAERAHNDILEVLQKHVAKVHSCSNVSRQSTCSLELPQYKI